MRMSEFDRLMNDEFGRAYATMLRRELHLPLPGSPTAEEALAAGTDPKAVWLAVCDQQSVPEERRYGRDIPPKS